jgi:hypothetical protein
LKDVSFPEQKQVLEHVCFPLKKQVLKEINFSFIKLIITSCCCEHRPGINTFKMELYIKYDKQDQQGMAAFNERDPNTTQQQEPGIKTSRRSPSQNRGKS